LGLDTDDTSQRPAGRHRLFYCQPYPVNIPEMCRRFK
jgi:hypothetical protein